MREVFLVSEDSTESSLVFRSPQDAGAEEFFLAVTPELRSILAGEGASAEVSAAPEPEPEPVQRPEKEPDPRLSAPLAMSPREIQGRVRAGASIAELAEENGVTESRIEPYAHPVLLERARIAELGKQAHPVRENGPAKLTLWEVLATAFATRGHDLTTATWDAYRDATNQWIVRVDWKAGLSDNHAEWALNLHNTSNSTADPRTPVAADLIDPEFIQPVRTLTSIGGYAEDPLDDAPAEDPEVVTEHLEHSGADEEGAERPADDDAPRNRRRKAVTPHWEDVLLGVRTNTKRPKK